LGKNKGVVFGEEGRLMRTNTKMVWIWTVLLALCLTNNAVARKIITSPDWPDPFVAGQLFVMFTDQAIEPIVSSLEEGVEKRHFNVVIDRGHARFALSDPDTRPWVTGIASMDSLNKTHGLKSIDSAVHDPYGRKTRQFLLIFPEDTDILHLVNLYAQLKEVEYVYPNAVATVTATTPNDSLFAEQWAHNVNHLQSEYGWDIETGDSDIIIAIHDTGVDWEHPDLKDNIWVNPGEDLDSDGVVGDTDDLNTNDDDSNGFDDDIIGWDFHDGDWNPQHTAGADTSHGTKVAGIAAAIANNDSGVAGVAWSCKIMPIRVGEGHSLDFLLVDDAIQYARKNGADVLNMSWRYYVNYPHIRAEIDSAYADGLVLVGAAGNENTSTIVYPAGYDSVIAVAAVDSNDVKKDNSNYGSWITVSAPGVANWTTKYVNGAANPHQYHLGYATSIATAHVSGLAGLLLSYDSSLTNSEIRDIIEQSADDIDSQNPSYQGQLGTGRINVFKALFRAKGYGSITADVTWYNDITLTGDVTVNNGVTLTINPGVTMEFATTDASSGGRDASRCELIVHGTLTAEGTSANPIVFHSTNGGTTEDEWYGIVFESDADDASSVEYADIKNAEYGVYCDHASPDIEHSTITYSSIGVKGVTMESGGSISYNTIHNTITAVSLSENSSVPVTYNNLSSNVRSGYFTGATSTVQYDTLNSNSNEGISLFSGSDVTFGHNRILENSLWGVRLWQSDPTMRGDAGYNNITDNGNSEIYCQGNSQPELGEDVDGKRGHNDIYDDTGYAIYTDRFIQAEKNYWGSTDSLTIRSYMFPADSVDFSPCDNNSNTKPVLVADSDPVLEQLHTGIEAEELGDYRTAIGAYQSVLQDPQHRWTREALSGLHRSYFALREDLEEFRGVMKQVAGQTRDAGIKAKAEELARKAFVLEGDYDQALGEYQAVVEAGGEDALAAMVHLGEIFLYHLKDVSRAKGILTEVITQAPERPEAFAARMALDDAEAMPDLKPGASQPRLAEEGAQPEVVVLAPNYPNPFNPQTTLSFALSEAMWVRLVVYNLLGQNVRVLVDGIQQAGTHTVLWDGRDAHGLAVGSGLYFARMAAEGTVHTQKLLLVR
jgi:subtilisin family serine protease/tetratricopeptide (TPR) repeat protein